MRSLEIPFHLAGRGVQRHEGRAVQILSLAVATIKVGGWLADAEKDHAALDVDRHRPPNVDTRAILPTVALPRLVARLARPGDGMKRPNQLPGTDAPGANIAHRAKTGRFLHAATRDHQVLIYYGRRRDAITAVGEVVRDTFAHVDHTFVAESRGRLPCFQISRFLSRFPVRGPQRGHSWPSST